ncbi:MAG: hypothetical protein ACXAEU_12645 [Candidatus Hodarchaeales archaeon]
MDSQHWTRACYRLQEKLQHLTKGAAKGPTNTYQPLLAEWRYLQSGVYLTSTVAIIQWITVEIN